MSLPPTPRIGVPLIIAMAMLLVLTIPAAGPAQDKAEKVRLRWAFGALTGPENNRQLVSVSKRAELQSGDQFKLMIQPVSDCYVYLIYHGSRGEVQLLFPEYLGQFDQNYRAGRQYMIPEGDLWFALDETTGRETFYLMATSKRLSGLEALLNQHAASGSDANDALAKSILAEIKKIRKTYVKLSATAERPVVIGGTMRGIAPKSSPAYDINKLAVEIAGAEFVSRTIRIDHQ